MNSHDHQCNSSDEWHQNLLDGCNDIFNRLSDIIDILKTAQQKEIPAARRLRLFSRNEETLIPVPVKMNRL